MAEVQLIVDDEYCKERGRFLKNKGEKLDQIVTEYVKILQEIRGFAIMEGETANILSQYIDCCHRLESQITVLSNAVDGTITCFLSAVDEADDYLF